MFFMKQDLLIGILVGSSIIIYLLLRRIGMSAARQYEQEIEQVLTSDKHKVKGRFE